MEVKIYDGDTHIVDDPNRPKRIIDAINDAMGTVDLVYELLERPTINNEGYLNKPAYFMKVSFDENNPIGIYRNGKITMKKVKQPELDKTKIRKF